MSSYDNNQKVITDVMQSMMAGIDTDEDGNPDVTLSLGEAVTRAKQTMVKPNSSGNLMGDPSLRISAQKDISNMATQTHRSY